MMQTRAYTHLGIVDFHYNQQLAHKSIDSLASDNLWNPRSDARWPHFKFELLVHDELLRLSYTLQLQRLLALA